jgi:hypothetical protein
MAHFFPIRRHKNLRAGESSPNKLFIKHRKIKEVQSYISCQMVYFHTKFFNFDLFGRPRSGKIENFFSHLVNLRQFGTFQEHLIFLYSFAIFFNILVRCNKTNLATVSQSTATQT